MNEYDATEIAFKNGYEQAVRDVFADIEKCRTFGAFSIHGYIISDINEIKKKYIPQCTNCQHFVGCECFSGKICDQYEVKNERQID